MILLIHIDCRFNTSRHFQVISSPWGLKCIVFNWGSCVVWVLIANQQLILTDLIQNSVWWFQSKHILNGMNIILKRLLKLVIYQTQKSHFQRILNDETTMSKAFCQLSVNIFCYKCQLGCLPVVSKFLGHFSVVS